MQKNVTLSFSVQPFADVLAVIPIINGLPLSETVSAFEREHHFEPAGGYGGLIPRWFNYGSLKLYFLGMFEPGSYFAKMGRIYVLGCRCGEVGCWPLTCKVGHTMEGMIIWDSFQQPHRPSRDYSRLGSFVFAGGAYVDAVTDLEAEILRHRS